MHEIMRFMFNVRKIDAEISSDAGSDMARQRKKPHPIRQKKAAWSKN
jgi:hypothetical protein